MRRLPGVLLALVACSNEPSAGTTLLEVVQAPPTLALPGYPLHDSVVVRAVDDEGHPRAGVEIEWVSEADATVMPGSSVTDADGRAAAYWVLGPQEGEQYLEARTLEDSSVTFTVTAQVFQADLLFGSYGSACGLRSGDIWCFARGTDTPVSGGLGWNGQLAVAPPVRISTGQQFTELAAQGSATCGLDSIGGITCYPGSTHPGLPPLASIVAGGSYGTACGLTRSDSTAWCNGTAASQLDTVRLIEFGVEDGLACGRRVNGSAVCWTRTGSVTSAATDVPGGHLFTRIAVGEEFACGIDGSNVLWCWGDGRYGQLGGAPASSTPVQVLDNVTAVALSDANGLALRNGAAVHWGFWNGGVAPSAILSLAGKSITALSHGTTQCVLLALGHTWCAEELWVDDGSSTFYPVQPVE